MVVFSRLFRILLLRKFSSYHFASNHTLIGPTLQNERQFSDKPASLTLPHPYFYFALFVFFPSGITSPLPYLTVEPRGLWRAWERCGHSRRSERCRYPTSSAVLCGRAATSYTWHENQNQNELKLNRIKNSFSQ